MDDNNVKKKNNRIKLEPKYRSGTNTYKEADKEEEFEMKPFNLEHFIKKNAIRLVISMMIFAVLFAINSLPFSMTQKITQGVRWALTYQMNLREDFNNEVNIISAISNQIGKLTERDDIIGETDENVEYMAPVNGVVSSPFEDILHPVFNTTIEARGIEISGKSESDIQSIQKGRVVSISQSVYGGEKIIIQHDNQFRSVYEGCYDTTVSENTEVEKGTVLGKTKSMEDEGLSYIYFELWKGETAVNPLDYIDLEVDLVS